MYQKILLIGRLTAEPEMRYTPAGNAVTNFSIAVDDDYTDANGTRVERTIFVRVSCWGKTAENANQYLSKGSPVLVEGNFSGEWKTGTDGKQTCNGPKVWTAQDGTPHASFEVNARNIRFLPGGPKKGAQGTATAQQPDTTADQDIPF
jgi:single-strand DNA-binding protein